jgi:hypothetical protein
LFNVSFPHAHILTWRGFICVCSCFFYRFYPKNYFYVSCFAYEENYSRIKFLLFKRIFSYVCR